MSPPPNGITAGDDGDINTVEPDELNLHTLLTV